MTTDQQLASALRGHYAEEPVERADRERMTRAALHQISSTPQGRHRRWPLPVDSVLTRGSLLSGRVSPPAPNGSGGEFTVFSALKPIAAVAIVALFAGFLLAGVLTTGQPDEAMPAAGTGERTEMPTACPPGSTPHQPGPADQPRPLDGELKATAELKAAAFDGHAGRIVYLVGAVGGVETWLFDVCTNTWSLAQRGGVFDDMPLSAIYDPGARLTLAVNYSGTWAYDSSANTWTRRDAVVPEGLLPRLAYDAAAGRVIVGSMEAPYPVWSYDTKADAWQEVGPVTPSLPGESGTNRMLTYEGTVDRLLAYDGGSVELLDEESGTWVSTEAKSPVVIYGGWLSWGGEITYDEAVGRTVLVGFDAVIAYDAAADEWETLALSSDSPATGQHHQVVYDPINERIVVMGGLYYASQISENSLVQRDDVWAFDARTREWIELVPSLARPPD